MILMGVSGSGKSTVGRALAKALQWDFVEGDVLHPPENIRKMGQGIPLRASDRWPWLTAIHQKIEALQADGCAAVITCSALKQSYRDRLRDGQRNLKFIYLKGSRETFKARLKGRQGHFMKEQMLDSQLATLEEPEDAIVMNEDELNSADQTVQAICDCLGLPCQ